MNIQNIQTTMYKILGLAGIVLAGLSACPGGGGDDGGGNAAEAPPECSSEVIEHANLHIGNESDRQLVLYTAEDGGPESPKNRIPANETDCYITLDDISGAAIVRLVFYDYDDVAPAGFDASGIDPFFDAGSRILTEMQEQPVDLQIPANPTADNLGTIELSYSDPDYQVTVYKVSALTECPSNLDALTSSLAATADLLTHISHTSGDQAITLPLSSGIFRLLFAYWEDDQDRIEACERSDEIALNALNQTRRIEVPVYVPDPRNMTTLRVINAHSIGVTVYIDNEIFEMSEFVEEAGTGISNIVSGGEMSFTMESSAAGIPYSFHAVDILSEVVERDVITLSGGMAEWRIDGSVIADQNEPCNADYIQCVDNLVCGYNNTCQPTQALGGACNIVTQCQELLFCAEEIAADNGHANSCQNDVTIVVETAASVEIGYADGDSALSVTQDLDLPTSGGNGVAIAWSSDTPAIIADDGRVTRLMDNAPVILMATLTRGVESATREFMVTAFPTDEGVVTATAAALEIGYAEGDSATSVTQDLTLPTAGMHGVAISWMSDMPAVISNDGTVTLGESAVMVRLTATLTKGEAQETLIFMVTVLIAGTDEEIVALAIAALEIGYAEGDSAASVTQDLTLPTVVYDTMIAWSSSAPETISTSGQVTRGLRAMTVTLTATLTRGAASDTKVFVLGVSISDQAAVDANRAALEIGYAEGDSAAGITDSLDLPTSGSNGVDISWESSNPTAVTDRGIVTIGGATVEVTLTATMTKGEASAIRVFVVMIRGAVAAAKAALEIGYAEGDSANGITQNVILLTSGLHNVAISWSSNNPAVLASTGTVTRSNSNVAVTLTATLTSGAATDTKQFLVTVSCNTGFCWTPRFSRTSQQLNGIVWSGSQYVAVGNFGTILTSSDGVSWTPRTSGTSHLYGIVWSGSQYVAVGNSGTILTSSDGVGWTPRTSGTSQWLYGIVWSGSQYVAVGFNGTILTSSDGVSWTRRTSGTSQTLLDIVWSGSQYVAVGESGRILTSSDGVGWTGRTSGTNQLLYGIVWSGSQYVAVGNSGTILTSSDGVGWTPRTSGTGQFLYGIVWSGSQYVAVGNFGTILTSSDGVGWTGRTSGTSQWLLGIVWSGSQYVAVGNFGTILTSP